MLSLRNVLRDYRQTGAPNEHVQLWGWLDDVTFLTKGGDVGVVMRVRGADYECLDTASINTLSARLDSAFNILSDRVRIYQYLFKSSMGELPHREYDDPVVAEAVRNRVEFFRNRDVGLHSVEIYYVIVHEAPRQEAALLPLLAQLFENPAKAFVSLKAAWSSTEQIRLLRHELDHARRLLLERVHQFETQVADFLQPRLLGKHEAFRVLYRLVNVDPVKRESARLRYNRFLDYFLCESGIEFYGHHMRIDEYYVKVLVLTTPTYRTLPLILKELYELPADFHVALEWRRLANTTARERINALRRHKHNSKVSMPSLATSAMGTPQTLDVLQDEGKAASVALLGEALKVLERGEHFGELALTVVVYDRDRTRLDHAVTEFYKVFANENGRLANEIPANLPNAFWATLPGGQDRQMRTLMLTNKNRARYSFLFTLSTGEWRNELLQDEYLAVCETQQGTPFALNLHANDVAHVATLGMVGAGKSTLQGFLILHAQKYKPYTFIFDRGGSYRAITELCGGSYVELGGAQPFRLNPFCLADSKDNRAFLRAFVRLLLEGQGAEPLTTDDLKDLDQCIGQLYGLQPQLRTLSSLAAILKRKLAARLHAWVKGGVFDFAFDNAEDHLTFARFQAFDFDGIDHKYKPVLEPLLFYVLQRASEIICDPDLTNTFKIFEIDEFAHFVRNPIIREYFVDALLQWRKKNAAVLLCTQSVDEILKTGYADSILANCPTKFLLANPNADLELYADRLHLNDREVEALRRLQPKRQLLMKRSDMAKVLNLDLDPMTYWLTANDPKSNEQRARAFAEHGFQKGLQVLARSMS